MFRFVRLFMHVHNVLEQAVLKLMDRGIEQDKSIERVSHNFSRLNSSNLLVTLESSLL